VSGPGVVLDVARTAAERDRGDPASAAAIVLTILRVRTSTASSRLAPMWEIQSSFVRESRLV